MATAPSLASAQERFLAHHEALNHSHKQLAHYRTTFRDFDRFLGATRRIAPFLPSYFIYI